MNFTCSYTINGVRGRCFGVSVKQMYSRARLDYCRKTAVALKPALALAQSYPVKLVPDPIWRERCVDLYKLIRSGDYTPADYTKYNEISNFLDSLNE